MKLDDRSTLAATLAFLLALAAPALRTQAAPDPSPAPTTSPQAAPSPSPAAAEEDEEKAEAAETEAQPKEEEFKEPTAADEKAREKEIQAKGCPKVDVKFSAATDKKSHPTPEPEPGKALVYVVRPTMYGNKIQSKLAIDGQWVGLNRGRNYFFVQLDPGEHYLCSKAENRSVMALKVEAGKTYFVEQKIRMGFMKARNKLAPMSEEKGREKLVKLHPSTWAQKK